MKTKKDEGLKLEFARLLFEGKTQIDAIKQVGIKGKHDSLVIKAMRWARSEIVRTEMERLKVEAGKKVIITRAEVEQILADHARGTLADFIDEDENGDFWFDISKARKEKKLHLLEQVELEEHYEGGQRKKEDRTLIKIKKFKLHSVQGAAKQLREMNGWDILDKKDSDSFSDWVKTFAKEK